MNTERNADHRMQLELRRGVDIKKLQGFEVVERGDVITMKRGPVKVQVSMLNGSVIVRNV